MIYIKKWLQKTHNKHITGFNWTEQTEKGDHLHFRSHGLLQLRTIRCSRAVNIEKGWSGI